jgi:hypothetical protein
MEAYMLVQTDSGSERIASILRGISGIVLAEDIYGPYNAIVRASLSADVPDLGTILFRIADLPGVIRALWLRCRPV